MSAGHTDLKPCPKLVEATAQFLHDEGGFEDAWPCRTWPEHSDDTGQREGGFVKIVPSDVQAKFRDVAQRLHLSLLSRDRAIEAAEADLLGRALEVLTDTAEQLAAAGGHWESSELLERV